MNELTRNQSKALAALLANSSISAAAKEAGLTRTTIHAYLKDDTFKKKLREEQDAILLSTTSALIGLAEEAVGVIVDILRADNSITGGVRSTLALKLRAAQAWLDNARKAVELDDLVKRVSDIEGKLS